MSGLSLNYSHHSARTLKNAVFFDIMPCGSCKERLFGGMYRYHLQGDKYRRARNNVRSNLERCTQLADSCRPDDGGDTFLGNVGPYKSRTASYPRRRHSPKTPPSKNLIYRLGLCSGDVICFLWGMNWGFESQNTEFFIVTAMKTSNINAAKALLNGRYFRRMR
jgi:hypothetical protein